MAPTIPQGEPATVTAGDTWQWNKNFSDYAPTDGSGTWTLSYAIVGAGAIKWDATYAVASGGGWVVTIPASATEGLAAGAYRWSAILTGGSGYANQRATPESGVFTVTANPALLIAGDTLSFAEKNLAVVEAALTGRLTADMQSYSIGGRAVVSIPIAELYAMRTKLQHEVYRERNPGRSNPVRLVQFTGPR